MQITYSPKFELGDVLYHPYLERYYLIQDFGEIGGTVTYNFLILSPSSYPSVEVAASSVDIDHEYYKVA
jgi:hypothetical protein